MDRRNNPVDRQENPVDNEEAPHAPPDYEQLYPAGIQEDPVDNEDAPPDYEQLYPEDENLFPDNDEPFLQAPVGLPPVDPPLLDADQLAALIQQPHPIAVVVPAAVQPPAAQAPAAAAMAMDAAQLALLLAAVRPTGKKLTPFTSGDGLEFVSWRRNFRLAVEINGWQNDDDRGRREAAAAIEEPAARLIADIPTDAGTAEEYLDLCEARFMPAAAADVAKVALETAIQEGDETIIQWHTRLRAFFVRAYPNIVPDRVEDDDRLIRQFILKCKSAHVRSDAWKVRPVTFAAAYTAASNAAASQMVLEANNDPGAPPKMGRIQPGMMQMQRARTSPRKDQQRCWFCDEAGHLRLHCTMWLKAKRMMDDDPRAPRKMREASPKPEDNRRSRGGGRMRTTVKGNRGPDARRQTDYTKRRDQKRQRGLYGMEAEESDHSDDEEESGN